MSEMTTAIAKIKTAVSQEEWRQRIEACQNSGMKVKDWCEENEVTVGRYYYHLRKLREAVVEENQIVPLRQSKTEGTCGIQIQAGNLQISLPETAAPEQLQAIVRALKPC